MMELRDYWLAICIDSKLSVGTTQYVLGSDVVVTPSNTTDAMLACLQSTNRCCSMYRSIHDQSQDSGQFKSRNAHSKTWARIKGGARADDLQRKMDRMWKTVVTAWSDSLQATSGSKGRPGKHRCHEKSPLEIGACITLDRLSRRHP